MAWILLEGLDRSGKSTVAGYYKEQGYKVVHMSSPNKKYFQPGYAGPSYLEEMVDMYSTYAGKDVVFDRTVYGEIIWPEVFNRLPLLNEEDLEYLAQLEYNQSAVKYLLSPDDVDAHWKRCVDNKEPINRIQFVQAARLYDKLELEKGFERKQLSDFAELAKQPVVEKVPEKNEEVNTAGNSIQTGTDANQVKADKSSRHNSNANSASTSSMEDRLDRANAIKSILSSKIIKKKDGVYDSIEQDIRKFLQKDLERLFTQKTEQEFTDDEVQILKTMAQRIKAKME